MHYNTDIFIDFITNEYTRNFRLMELRNRINIE